MIERQVIVTWYTPEEKLPPEDIEMVCTINGEALGIKFENAIVLLSWHPDEGWTSMEYFFSKLEVIAWCDLMPYGYKEK